MDINSEVKEYQVLGHTFRLKESSEDEVVSATEIVSYVDEITQRIRESLPNISGSQLSALVALEMAKEKLTLEKEFKTEVAGVKKMSDDALKLIGEALPKTH